MAGTDRKAACCDDRLSPPLLLNEIPLEGVESALRRNVKAFQIRRFLSPLPSEQIPHRAVRRTALPTDGLLAQRIERLRQA